MRAPATSLAALPGAQSLLAQARSIILRPRETWPEIAKEDSTTASLLTGYIAPLAAIGPVAGLIGSTLLGVRLPFGGSYRVPFGSALVSAVMQYALAIGAVFAMAWIIDALAPRFGGERSRSQALKVATYACTPSWLLGILGLVPLLSFLGLFGLYSGYLVYLGLPVVMRSPEERALGYTAAVIGCAIALFMVAGTIAARFIAYPSLFLPVR
ncbi:MAG: Yip1 family protein [Gemmatimonadota bacterium]